jgi:hypothetical protein
MATCLILIGVDNLCHYMSINKKMILISLLGTIFLASTMMTSLLNKSYADNSYTDNPNIADCKVVNAFLCRAGSFLMPPLSKLCRLAMDPFCNPVIPQDPNCPTNTSCDPNQDPNCPTGTSCDPNQPDPNCEKVCNDPNQPQQDPNCPTGTSCIPNCANSCYDNGGGSSSSNPGSSDPGNSQGGSGTSGGDPGTSGGGEQDSGCSSAEGGSNDACTMSQ